LVEEDLREGAPRDVGLQKEQGRPQGDSNQGGPFSFVEIRDYAQFHTKVDRRRDESQEVLVTERRYKHTHPNVKVEDGRF